MRELKSFNPQKILTRPKYIILLLLLNKHVKLYCIGRLKHSVKEYCYFNYLYRQSPEKKEEEEEEA